MASKSKKTTVGQIDQDVLEYTAGRDVELDHALIEVDCFGTAAHVTMLSRMPVKPTIFSTPEKNKVLKELGAIVKLAQEDKFKIKLADQDVHLAVERTLTAKLGDLGKKVHTARSRNDQVALDLRLYGKLQLLDAFEEITDLITVLLGIAKKHVNTPMVGRTHMQPAMPSSVALFFSAHAESLLDDAHTLMAAYEVNDQCPLGSAAGYGVPLPIDRKLVSDLLGFAAPCHNVLYASNARGKVEGIILNGLGQIMNSLSRIAQDMMLYTLPEFGYFTLPKEYCMGSSIMPNKSNPDVMELVRAKTWTVLAGAYRVSGILSAAPSGYNRDLQEAKEPFMEGFAVTRQTLRIMTQCLKGLTVNKKALNDAFDGGVFATDKAIELVGGGMPFRDAYHHVKENLDELESMDALAAIKQKTHLGATAGLDFAQYADRVKALKQFTKKSRSHYERKRKALLGV